MSQRWTKKPTKKKKRRKERQEHKLVKRAVDAKTSRERAYRDAGYTPELDPPLFNSSCGKYGTDLCCQAITNSGVRCSRVAVTDKTYLRNAGPSPCCLYCTQHAKMYLFGAAATLASNTGVTTAMMSSDEYAAFDPDGHYASIDIPGKNAAALSEWIESDERRLLEQQRKQAKEQSRRIKQGHKPHQRKRKGKGKRRT